VHVKVALPLQTGPVKALRLLSDERALLSGSIKATRTLPSASSTGVHVKDALPLQNGPVKALRLVDEHTLLSGSTDGSLHFWDVQNRQKPELVHTLCMPDSG